MKVYTAAQNGTTYLIQSRLGYPIEPRNYAEHSFEWMSWYLGGVLIFLTIIGAVILIKEIMTNKKFEYLALLFTVLLTSAIYFTNPKITPDQVWAMRRFIPVIIPCFILLGIFSFSFIYERINTESKNVKVFVAILFSSYLILQPLLITRPFIKVKEYENSYNAFKVFCNKLPPNSGVLWLGDNTFALSAVQTTRSVCGINSAGIEVSDKNPYKNINSEKLKKIYADSSENGVVPYLALQGGLKTHVEFDKSILKYLNPIVVYGFTKVEQTLTGPPTVAVPYANSIELGKINQDGTITPVY